jgi:hypothetical protein
VVTPLYAIDCHTRTVDRHPWTDDTKDWGASANSTRHMPFVALSYVWGPQKKLSTKLPEQGPRYWSLPLKLPSQCPKTVEDAMSIVKQLGFRYLWVDRYCINHSDVSNKHDQIRVMDLIYRKAAFTIAAADGEDAESGLAGVSKALSSPDLNEHATSRWYRLKSEMLILAHWNKRAWTYQEYILSNHVMVFTSAGVLTLCRCHDNMRMPIPSKSQSSEAQATLLKHPIIFGDAGNVVNFLNDGSFIKSARKITNAHEAYETHVIRYTRRRLTFGSDSINAIGAILESLKHSVGGLDFCYGLPITSSIATKGQVSVKHTIFVHSLCWTYGPDQHKSEEMFQQRREEFPSWSWAGWSGNVLGWIGHFTGKWQPDSNPTLEYLDWRGRPHQMDHLMGRSHIDKAPQVLLVSGLCKTIQFNKVGSRYFLRLDDGVVNDSLFCFHPTRTSHSGTEDWSSRLITDTWIGIRLGLHTNEMAHLPELVMKKMTVLVVGKLDPDDEAYERIGIMTMHKDWFTDPFSLEFKLV